MTTPPPPDPLRQRCHRLGLYGLLTHGEEMLAADWLPALLDLEEAERTRRSLERRIRNARLGAFKPMADFDWRWPKKLDRQLVEEILRLGFVAEAANVVLVGPNGIGKTMIAQNLAYQALLRGVQRQLDLQVALRRPFCYRRPPVASRNVLPIAGRQRRHHGRSQSNRSA